MTINRIAFLSVAILMFSNVLSQDVPNGNFENWVTTGGYAQPTSWSTPNPSTASLFTYTVTKETTWVQSGNSSAKLQTKSALGLKIPGLLTLGTFSINIATMEATISGGIPFTHRPSSLTGYLQYQPKSGDNCFVGVLILRKNGNSWDTLGTGSYTNTATLNSWNQFVVPINYSSSATPTHLNIIIMPSDKDDPQTGSILYVDNLTFQYPTEVSEIKQDGAVKWNYLNNRLLLQNIEADIQNGVLEIFSTDGRLLHREALQRSGDGFESSSIEAISHGVYLARFYGTNAHGFSHISSFKIALQSY